MIVRTAAVLLVVAASLCVAACKPSPSASRTEALPESGGETYAPAPAQKPDGNMSDTSL